MKSIKALLEENPSLPFKLLMFLDSSYDVELYYVAVETDDKKTKVDMSAVTDNYESKEEMESFAQKIKNAYRNIVEVVEIQC